jgi:hypothetical protein
MHEDLTLTYITHALIMEEHCLSGLLIHNLLYMRGDTSQA